MSASNDHDTHYRVSLKFNFNTDADIIEMLESQPSRQRYIKELIRRHIRECNEYEDIPKDIFGDALPLDFTGFENDPACKEWLDSPDGYDVIDETAADLSTLTPEEILLCWHPSEEDKSAPADDQEASAE